MIRADVDRRVTISFNAFDVEGAFSGTCYYDYVEVNEEPAFDFVQRLDFEPFVFPLYFFEAAF